MVLVLIFVKVLNAARPDKIKLLIRLINLHWKRYKKYLFANKYIKVPWGHFVFGSKVIPIGNELFYSHQVFLKSEKTNRLFGDSVKYYPKKIEYDFAKEIGFNVTVDGSGVVNYLRELSRNHVRLSMKRRHGFINTY